MAATPVEVIVGIVGLTGCTLKLYPRGSDSIANGAGDALTAQTNRTWVYRATVDEAISGLHEAVVVDGSNNVLFVGVIDLEDTTAVQTVAELAHAITESTGGTGARTVTITVNDGTDALESASVRLTKGGETYVQATNVSGVATFNVDDGTWTVAITLAGYTYAGTTLVVDGTETVTYSMTAVNVAAPTNPNLTTGVALCLGTNGLLEAGVTVYAEMVDGPGTAGYALDTGTITMTSDANGIITHTGFVRGAQYRFRRGTSKWWGDPQTAPDAASWDLGEVLGKP